MTHTYTVCSVVVILIEAFHLTAAQWGMLGGRNKELDKLCSVCISTLWEHVYVRAAALRLHAVLLCLFYFVSSINDEAPGGREWGTQPSPGGKCSPLGIVPSASPPPPTIMPHDPQTRTVCACMENHVPTFRGHRGFDAFFVFVYFLLIVLHLSCIKNVVH